MKLTETLRDYITEYVTAYEVLRKAGIEVTDWDVQHNQAEIKTEEGQEWVDMS